MSSDNFTSVPAWISHPLHLKNVINDLLSSTHDVSSYINLTDSTLFHSGLNQAFHWRRQLIPSIPDNTVVFSLLGAQGLQLPDVMDVCRALKGLCSMQNLVEVYKAPNSTFIGISFNNPEDVSKVMSNFVYYRDCLVFYIKPTSPLTHNFKLLWLPPVFNINRVRHLLMAYSSKISLHHEVIQTDDGIFTPTNVVRGTLQLLPEKSLKDIPHLFPLPSPHRGDALLIISGRPSMCLRCRKVGHLRKTCPFPHCAICHYYHATSSPCASRSYSHVLSESVSWSEDISDFDSSGFSTIPHTVASSDFVTPPSSQDVNPIIQSSSNASAVSSLTIAIPSNSEGEFLPIVLPGSSPAISRSIISPSPAVSPTSVLKHSHLPVPPSQRVTRSMCSKSVISCTSSLSSTKALPPHSDEPLLSSDGVSIRVQDLREPVLDSKKVQSGLFAVLKDEMANMQDDYSASSHTASSQSKRKRANSPDHVSADPVSSSDHLPEPSSGIWSVEVDTAFPLDTDNVPNCNHSILVDDTSLPKSVPLLVSSVKVPSPFRSINFSSDPSSTCVLTCLKCNGKQNLRWPLRLLVCCRPCDLALSHLYYSSHYPLADRCSLLVKLAPLDQGHPYSIVYMQQVLDSGISIEIKEFGS